MSKHAATDTRSPEQKRRQRLIDLAEWAGAQKARQDLGLDSEWNQAAWVDVYGIVTNGEAKWSCGTAACLAGRTAIDDGGLPLFSWYDPDAMETKYGPWSQVPVHHRDTADPSDARMWFPHLGQSEWVDEYARQALGLTTGQANSLFDGNNDYERVIEVIGNILDDPAWDPHA